MNGESNFLKAMEKNGIPPPVCLIGDGKLHRFTVTGDRPERNSGWYVFHPDGIPAGAFGDWRGGISLTWCGKRPESMTEAERTAYRKAVEKIQKDLEADEQ
jgi:putative DNA primase/helicase